MNSRPLVSIITAVYNGEKYLEETLLSIFAQTYQNYELIIIDDGSPSRECQKICQKYAGRLKYFFQENKGLSGARNRGLKEAKGEYIAFVDQDDLWLPKKLEKQVEHFERLREDGIPVGLVYTPLIEIDETSREISRSSYGASGNLFAELIYTNNIGTPSSVMTRRDIIEQCGVFDENIVSYSDWELFIRIAHRYEIHCLNQYLTRYRIAQGSLSENLELMDNDVTAITNKVLATYPEYFSRHHIGRKAYLDPIRRETATIWKYMAYRKLFLYGDGVAFRNHIRRGWQRSPSVIGLNPWVYVFLSLLSVKLCQRTNNRGQGK